MKVRTMNRNGRHLSTVRVLSLLTEYGIACWLASVAASFIGPQMLFEQDVASAL